MHKITLITSASNFAASAVGRIYTLHESVRQCCWIWVISQRELNVETERWGCSSGPLGVSNWFSGRTARAISQVLGLSFLPLRWKRRLSSDPLLKYAWGIVNVTLLKLLDLKVFCRYPRWRKPRNYARIDNVFLKQKGVLNLKCLWPSNVCWVFSEICHWRVPLISSGWKRVGKAEKVWVVIFNFGRK